MPDAMRIDPGVRLPPGYSQIEGWARHLRSDRDACIEALPRATLLTLLTSWNASSRAAQMPPEGDWRTWLILAGRGFGKTRAGAEWVRACASVDGRVRIALVAATLAEGRAVMVEGESGLLRLCAGEKVTWQSSTRTFAWANGAQAFLYSAGEPDSLRGPQHHFAWCDEVAKWSHAEAAWRNLEMGLRLGTRPRIVATTTPRPTPLIRRLAAEAVVTRGRTADNAAHLAESFVADMGARYGGTAIGRQELDGELIEEIEGALWSRALIERARIAAAPDLTRVVIGVDPPAGADATSDACGIVVVGLGGDGRAYVLADASVQGAAPEGWARAVAAAAGAHDADRIVAEANNGGAMVASVLRAADAVLPIRLVHAAHGKSARAEPVQALYAAGKAFHVGAFAALEDEMAGLMAGGGYEGPGRSPDRADALVWAMHELMLGPRGPKPGVRAL